MLLGHAGPHSAHLSKATDTSAKWNHCFEKENDYTSYLLDDGLALRNDIPGVGNCDRSLD